MTPEAYIEENLNVERRQVKEYVYSYHCYEDEEHPMELIPWLENMLVAAKTDYSDATHIEFLAETHYPRSRGGFTIFRYIDEPDEEYLSRVEKEKERLRNNYEVLKEQSKIREEKDWEKMERFKQFMRLKKEFEPEKKNERHIR